MNDNLEIVDSSKDRETFVYYVSRINKKIPWPINSNIAVFALKDEPTKSELIGRFRMLTIGDDNVKIVSVNNPFSEIVYKSDEDK